MRVRILHADLDAFYASVEQRDQPALRNKPIAVGGGIVLAASYEARRFGVKTAMTGRQARALCPHLIAVEPRMEVYTEASRAVFDIFYDTSPNVEGLSIDEAFIDVTGLRRLVGPDEAIAHSLRARVAAEVGLPLSVGGASTKFLAKVASAVAKPDGLLIVAAGAELEFLHPLPVGSLWGVGPVTEAELARVGIHTVGEVAELDPEILVAKLGAAAGHHLHALANNRDPRRVEVGRRRRSIGSQRSFPAGSVDRDGARHLLLEVVERVARRLRTGRRIGRTVVLRLRYGDFASATRSRTLLEPTNVTATILDTARELLEAAWPEIEERGLTKVGIAIAGLSDDDAVQLTLPFTKGDRRRLDEAVDQIRERFGIASMTRAPLAGQPVGDVPLLPD
ncbi:MAG: DNA polymerase IV [Acidimicrobiia bacterium]|nr:DNA polymerase IV [Acidimicrobiia bacterium]